METAPIYDVGGSLPASLEAFSNRPCALPFSHPAYVPPTPQEVDRLIKLVGWSQNTVAMLVGVHYNPKKGSSTIRKWRASVDKDDYREIPYSAWRLMLVYASVVSVIDGLDATNKNPEKAIDIENGEGIVSLVVNGGIGDAICFQSALRIPHRKINVIGESQIIQDAVSKSGIEATIDFMPAGTTPLPKSIIIDATKYGSAK
jgi:hypothetical protein